jgi:hypothetical protein
MDKEAIYLVPILPKGFSYSEYYRGERELINPMLIALGLTLYKDWYSSEKDSFGPLSRASIWKRVSGTLVQVWYG